MGNTMRGKFLASQRQPACMSFAVSQTLDHAAQLRSAPARRIHSPSTYGKSSLCLYSNEGGGFLWACQGVDGGMTHPLPKPLPLPLPHAAAAGNHGFCCWLPQAGVQGTMAKHCPPRPTGFARGPCTQNACYCDSSLVCNVVATELNAFNTAVLAESSGQCSHTCVAELVMLKGKVFDDAHCWESVSNDASTIFTICQHAW